MTECKNCRHEIEENIIPLLPNPPLFFHILDDPYYREVECFCGCTKPEPKEAKNK